MSTCISAHLFSKHGDVQCGASPKGSFWSGRQCRWPCVWTFLRRSASIVCGRDHASKGSAWDTHTTDALPMPRGCCRHVTVVDRRRY